MTRHRWIGVTLAAAFVAAIGFVAAGWAQQAPAASMTGTTGAMGTGMGMGMNAAQNGMAGAMSGPGAQGSPMMGIASANLTSLVAAMNNAKGQDRIDAIKAVVNELVRDVDSRTGSPVAAGSMMMGGARGAMAGGMMAGSATPACLSSSDQSGCPMAGGAAWQSMPCGSARSTMTRRDGSPVPEEAPGNPAAQH